MRSETRDYLGLGISVFSLIVAAALYVMAARDMKAESTRMRNLVVVLARALEAQGLAKLSWRNGEMTGLQIELAGTSKGTSDAHANLTVGHKHE
jgi:hypothetical protein